MIRIRQKNKRTLKKMICVTLIAAWLVPAAPLWAGPQKKHDNDPYPEKGKIERRVPSEYQEIRGKNENYYFRKGVYYRKGPRGFVVVSPPRGLVVPVMPPGFETLIVAGVTHFLFGGVYYHKAPGGYMVVDEPQWDNGSYRNGNDDRYRERQVVLVNAYLLNVRSGPGVRYKVIDRAHRGERLVVLDKAHGWYRVRLHGGGIGWIMGKYIRNAGPTAKG